MADPQQVRSTVYPYLPVEGEVRAQRFAGQALLDTGFTGHLVLPEAFLTNQLGLPDGRIDWELADDRTVSAPV